MKTKISSARIKRIREQGYSRQTNNEISKLAFGNRFAYQLCTTLLLIGVSFANVPLLSIMFVVAFLSIILPNHAFDYIYNYFLSHKMNLPKLPRRSVQLKFACTMATFFIAGTIYAFVNNYMTAGYILGSILSVVAILVSTLDFCIPSIIFNSITKKKTSNKIVNTIS